jgi:hypothetical protein
MGFNFLSHHWYLTKNALSCLLLIPVKLEAFFVSKSGNYIRLTSVLSR